MYDTTVEVDSGLTAVDGKTAIEAGRIGGTYVVRGGIWAVFENVS